MRFLVLPIIAAVLISAPISAGQNVVIFLHNAWFEKNKDGQTHKTYGTYDFEGIKQALAGDGRVISPERGPNANPTAAADALVREIEALIESGRKPESIKVVGASKGAFIAQIASEKLNDPRIRWILVGGCHNKRMANGNIPKMTGKILSVYETTDTVAGACRLHPDLVKRAAQFREVAVSTGNDHGFQFTADPAWITPALAW